MAVVVADGIVDSIVVLFCCLFFASEGRSFTDSGARKPASQATPRAIVIDLRGNCSIKLSSD